MNNHFSRVIASEIAARADQVSAAINLLDEGNTVP
ncbi:MAG: Tex-like N-terminal domain-containing protein, partial [Plesiomonas sp.]